MPGLTNEIERLRRGIGFEFTGPAAGQASVSPLREPMPTLQDQLRRRPQAGAAPLALHGGPPQAELRNAPDPSLFDKAMQVLQDALIKTGMDPYRAVKLSRQVVGSDENIGMFDVMPYLWVAKAVDRAGKAIRDEDYGAAALHGAFATLGVGGRPIAKAVEAGARRVMPGAFEGPFAPLSRAEVISGKHPQGMDFDIVGKAEDVTVHGARAAPPPMIEAAPPGARLPVPVEAPPPINFGPIAKRPPAPVPAAPVEVQPWAQDRLDTFLSEFGPPALSRADQLPDAAIPMPAPQPWDGAVLDEFGRWAQENAPIALPAPEPVAGPVYQSGVERLIEALPQEKMTTGQAAAALRGASADEMQHTGLQELLMAGGKTTKTDLLAQARANPLEIRDVVKGVSGEMPYELILASDLEGGAQGFVNAYSLDGDTFLGNFENEEAARAALGDPGDVKFASYQLPGGENYKEMLLTLPEQAGQKKFDPSKVTITRNRRSATQGTTKVEYDGELVANYGDDPTRGADGVYRQKPDDYWMDVAERTFNRGDPRNTIPARSGAYTGGHYDEPNVLAHARYNTRQVDGDKTLFIEEIQSDWHSAPRKLRKAEVKRVMTAQGVSREEAMKLVPAAFGYQRGRLSDEEQAELVALREQDQQHTEGIGPVLTEAQHNRLLDLEDRADTTRGGVVPDAPFKSTWHELALKRMIREAAETGHDRIAWTPGKTVQAERYDLSKHIDRIKVSPRTHAATGERTRSASVTGKDGTTIEIGIDGDGVVDNVIGIHGPQEMVGKPLDEVVGKEMAEKIMAAEGHADFTGLDLKVGGEGMAGFYDKMMVSAANKIGKKFGAKVEVKEVNRPATDSVYPVTDGQGAWRLYDSSTKDYWGDATQYETNNEARAALSGVKGKEVWSMKITPALRREILEKGISPYRPKVLRRDASGKPIEFAPLPGPEVGDALLEEMGRRLDKMGPLERSLTALRPTEKPIRRDLGGSLVESLTGKAPATSDYVARELAKIEMPKGVPKGMELESRAKPKTVAERQDAIDKAKRSLEKLPDRPPGARGDMSLPASTSDRPTKTALMDMLDDDGKNFIKWVQANPHGKFLHANGKTGVSIEFSTTCARKSGQHSAKCPKGGCLYCFVAQPRGMADLSRAAVGGFKGSGFGNPQTKVLDLEHDYDPEIFRKMPPSFVNAMNKDGGLRGHAFGDFRPGVDDANWNQLLADAKKIGLWIKVITKEPEFVRKYGDHPNMRMNISIDTLPQNVSNGFTVRDAIAIKERYPNVRTRVVALTLKEGQRYGSMMMPDGKTKAIDVVTQYHGPTNFDKATGRRHNKLTQITIKNLQNPAHSPPGMLEEVLRTYGGMKGLLKFQDTWENMDARTPEFKQLVKEFPRQVCCAGKKCVVCQTNCGFCGGLNGSNMVKVIAFLLGASWAATESPGDDEVETGG